MHAYQSQLYADHYNFLRLLHFLESEIACYEADLERHPRLDVILDIFDYIQTYPERWHHPFEDAIFELLLIKQVPSADQIWGLKSEHKKLEQLTQQASELFSSVANDVVVPVEELVDVTREFIRRQQEHINIENRIAYPLIEQYLTEKDWDAVGKKVRAKIDPLFTLAAAQSDDQVADLASSQWLRDRALKAEYRNLYKTIMQMERGVSIGATARAKGSYNHRDIAL